MNEFDTNIVTGRFREVRRRSDPGRLFRIIWLWVWMSLLPGLLLLCGCGGTYELLLSEDGSVVEDTRNSTDADESAREDAAVSELSSGEDASASEASSNADVPVSEASSGEDGSASASSSAENALASERDADGVRIWVYVCGAVSNPGVYTLPAGSRVYHAIDAAGGLTEEADTRILNQAMRLVDGQQITVYTEAEVREAEQNGSLEKLQTCRAGQAGDADVAGFGEDQQSAAAGHTDDNPDPSGRVNLNTADRDTLMTLSGIGETRAEAIIAYREEHGGFQTIEEIMQISGIGQKSFEKLRGQITV